MVAILGWVVALTALGTAVYFYVGLERERVTTATWQARATEAEQELAETETKLRGIADKAVRPVDKAAASTGGAGAGMTGLMGSLFKNMLSRGPAQAGAQPGAASRDGSNSFLSAAIKMAKDPAFKDLMASQAEMMVPMMYGGLLKKLQLSPEQDREVRQILARSQKESMSAGLDMLDGDASIDQFFKEGFKPTPEMESKAMELATKMEDDKAQVRQELAEILTPKQLALYDDYEEHQPERMQQEQYETELSSIAPALTPENRARAVQVIMEESQSKPPPDGNPMNWSANVKESMQSHFEEEHDQLARARDRLAQEFPEDQLDAFDRFVSQKEQMDKISQQFMQTMFDLPTSSPDAKP
jgi:hypothetical protein